jgi:hypothetical protein
MFQIKVVEKIKTHILCSVTFFFRKSHLLWDNAEKCVGATRTTNDVTMWRIRVAYWISKATCIYAHVRARASGYAHARLRRPRNNTYCFSQQQWFSELASLLRCMYKVVQMWPGQTVTCLHTISPGHIWTTFYIVCLVSIAMWNDSLYFAHEIWRYVRKGNWAVSVSFLRKDGLELTFRTVNYFFMKSERKRQRSTLVHTFPHASSANHIYFRN